MTHYSHHSIRRDFVERHREVRSTDPLPPPQDVLAALEHIQRRWTGLPLSADGLAQFVAARPSTITRAATQAAIERLTSTPVYLRAVATPGARAYDAMGRDCGPVPEAERAAARRKLTTL